MNEAKVKFQLLYEIYLDNAMINDALSIIVSDESCANALQELDDQSMIMLFSFML